MSFIQKSEARPDLDDTASAGRRPLRVLIVSFYFPPYNTVGAIRSGKLSGYLARRGHDVRVLCADGLEFGEDLVCEIPAERVHRAPVIDVVAPARRLAALWAGLRRGRRPVPCAAADAPKADAAPAPAAAPGNGGGVLRRIANAYQELFGFPDRQIGWYPRAVARGARLCREWRPDLVFATAPPFTTHLVAARLAAKFGVPWVAEYRDRFFEDPYAPPSRFRKRAERFYEDRLIRRASALVTVSDPWAEDYRARFDMPVRTVFNGFDPGDFPAEFPRPPSDPNVLGIVYTGILYPERRDPSPLFRAIAQMGADGRSVRVAFYGADEGAVRALAGRHGVGAQVEASGRVPYDESIAIQMQADVLLLLQWNDPREVGNVPSKLFEYLAARRPVLGIGTETGVPARILAERDAGVVLNDPDAIAERLTQWLTVKRETGAVPLLPESVRDGLSREEQYRALEAFLVEIAGPGSGE